MRSSPTLSLLESLKNEFLATLYRGIAEESLGVYQRILALARFRFPDITENEEKILRQVQAAFRKLDAEHLYPPMAKPFKELGSILIKLARIQSASVAYVSYTDWQHRINLHSWQIRRLFESAVTCQLTTGCSNFCRRCNEWALPKIRAHFSVDAVETLIRELIAAGNTDTALYGASDPLDWKDQGWTLSDLLIPQKDRTGFSLLTKLPQGGQTALRQLITAGIPLSVSVTARNRVRVSAFETEHNIRLQKQHDADNLMIPACLDEDFTTVKPSITDAYGTEITPDGAFIVLPAFTSALHPMGHQKLAISRNTGWFPVKKIGRAALLVDYFKPLEVQGPGEISFHLDTLLDVQVENILLDTGADSLTPPGMRSIREYFEIFEEPARQRRKQMTRSVIRRIRKNGLAGRQYRDLSPMERDRYRARIQAHIDFCRKKPVREAELAAVSFFLAAILSYLKIQPEKRRILAVLLGQEPERLAKCYAGQADHLPVDKMFSACPENTWEVFRFYATAMTMGRYTAKVDKFIHCRPARFDPVSDRFVRPPAACCNKS